MKNKHCLAALALAISTHAYAAPGTPNIAWLPATHESGEAINVHWDMWWGENGTEWQLTDNGDLRCSGSLTANGQNQQSAECAANYSSGSHALQVSLCNDSGCSESNIVTINVNQGASSNVPPQVSISAPASAGEGDSITLSATASDSDGTVTSVTFLVDGIAIATDTTSPYSTNWVAQAGTHSLTAQALDNQNATRDDSVSISVTSAPNQLPSVSLVAPNANLMAGSETSFEINASDADGSISSVELYLNGNLLGTDTSAPYNVSWTAEAGDHSIYAVASDDRGGVSQSDTVFFAVAEDTNAAPSVSLSTAPTDAMEGDVLTLEAAASDSDGSVAQVDFYLNNQLLGSATSAPYSLQWTATRGSHTLRATAVDNQGKTASATSTFSVAADTSASHEDCRPDGLYATPEVQSPYCTVYDTQGRELMGSATRRVIGYFTSWRTGGNGPAYLAHQIPWDKLTHINYAFAHVDGNNHVSIGANTPTNAATGMEWPNVAGAEMDPSFSYKGHFNLLNKYKKQYPHVKTLISIGGWAETGGYFDSNGDRVNSGGFYTMTTNADGSVNTAGINTFADSVVEFLRSYSFDGADIDYEYPTSMNDAGNPSDFAIANARRKGLNASYNVLMKTLRQKLDIAGEQDGKHYMLTIASPSSGYLLRGMEAFEATQYLDYVNIMSYDLHGAWNQFVGPNAALFDNGQDAELIQWNAYGGQYKNIGYLNTDWAYHYFRGAMPAGRINIGVPYYTRGWQGVTGGTNGLWGQASLPNQSECPVGTGGSATSKCGNGAIGIDNLWHDKDENGNEMGAGSNPMWHAKNLENNILGDYLTAYGLDPINNPDHQLSGSYQRYYDDVLVAPWLWNAAKQVFISTEDEQSINRKADYVVENGIGGIMFWELAGDYQFNAAKGQYEMGHTLTTAIADKFANAPAYGNKRAEIDMPQQTLDISIKLTNFALGDNNFPITPDLIITNNTGTSLPGGTEFYFDIATSTPDNMGDQSAASLTIVSNGSNAAGNNVGGLENNFHRVKISTPSYLTLADGEEWKVVLKYYLPVSMPSNWVVKVAGEEFALSGEYPNLPMGSISSGGGNNGGGNTGGDCSNASDYPAYPNFPQKDWAGNPSHANAGDRMTHNNALYEAKWWTSATPGTSDWDLVCTF